LIGSLEAVVAYAAFEALSRFRCYEMTTEVGISYSRPE
jgi:hypothetical protein